MPANPTETAQEVNRLRQTLERFTDGDRQLYIAETDLLLAETELWALARKNLGDDDAVVDDSKYLVVENDDNGKPMLISREQFPLRYCVERAGFTPANYATIVANMAAATKQWMEICNVAFEHVTELDEQAGIVPSADLFVVRYVEQAQPIAAAFFPWYETPRRVVRICRPYFSAGLEFDTIGVLRHELGHVLGFRHEHIRREAVGSPYAREDTASAQPLGEYDKHSVMHYIWEGHGSTELAFTDKDKYHAYQMYPWPDRGPLVDPYAGS